MNGEECHNEWEITFEEIHRNGAIALPFITFTDIQEITVTSLKRIRSINRIARFWHQRAISTNLTNM
jgi:maltose phosphorylase